MQKARAGRHLRGGGRKSVQPAAEPPRLQGGVPAVGGSLPHQLSGVRERLGPSHRTCRPILPDPSVQQGQVPTQGPPDVRRCARLQIEAAKGLACDALDDQVWHRQQVARIVVGDQRRRPHTSSPGGRHGDRLHSGLSDMGGVVKRDPQHQVLAKHVDGVDDARLGQRCQCPVAQAVTGGNRSHRDIR